MLDKPYFGLPQLDSMKLQHDTLLLKKLDVRDTHEWKKKKDLWAKNGFLLGNSLSKCYSSAPAFFPL